MKKMACIAIAAVLIAAAAADGAFVGISLGRTQSRAKITNDSGIFGASSSGGQLIETNTTILNPDGTWTSQMVPGVSQIVTQLTRNFLQSSDSHDTKADFAYGILAGYR